MNGIALKMLIGDTGKYLGTILGITFASLLITQQASIFTGLMARSHGFLDDTNQADVWVMEPTVQTITEHKPLQDTMLSRVRGVIGVDWAMPLYKSVIRAKLDDGSYQACNVVGIDPTTMIGGPPKMVEGRLTDLRRNDAVIVDVNVRGTKLGKSPTTPGGKKIPLQIGDTIELNDQRGIVVGFSNSTRTFTAEPTVYTTYDRALRYAPPERRTMSYILVKSRDTSEAGVRALCDRIHRVTGAKALTQKEFVQLTYDWIARNTGIPINFGISITLGFIVGTAIAGQTFYNFTLDNLRHFGALKAMGVSTWTLLRMILLQAAIVGFIGYGLGVGGASLMGWASKGSELAFLMPWQLLVISASAVMLICLMAAALSIWKVIQLEAAIVFKS